LEQQYQAYTQPLPVGKTLCVFENNTLIFSSGAKWLMPLFELETFFKTFNGTKSNLSAHDTAVGKAAVVLMTRMKIRHIYTELGSSIAENYISYLNSKTQIDSEKIIFSCRNKVPVLLCATEDQLRDMDDNDEMYTLLRQRAKLVQGVDVEVKDVTFKYGITKPLSFNLAAGNRLMIVGENGSGKTTLLNMLIGKIKPITGSIRIESKKISELQPFTIGYIPQQTDSTEFSLSVEEVIALGIHKRDNEHKESIHKEVIRVLSRTFAENTKQTILEEIAQRSYTSLSGGEKQKVSLARCLAQNAKLLLLDEPTSALDANSRLMVVQVLRSLSLSEIPTIIIVTHDKELVTALNWKTLQIEEGTV
jgi:zinc transport system ATP-binding protein